MKIINQNKEAAKKFYKPKKKKTKRNKKSVQAKFLFSHLPLQETVPKVRERKKESETVKCFENAPMCYM